MILKLLGFISIAFLLIAGDLHAETLERFLQAQTTIRLYVDSAPGFGHQSAGVSVMARLRELGFTGEFEVVYQPSVAAKIKKIYPGFPQGVLNQIRYIAINDYVKSVETGSVQKVSLAISGADDGFGEKFSHMAHADNYLRLQPLGWGLPIVYGNGVQTLQQMINLPLANLNLIDDQQLLSAIDSNDNMSTDKKKFVIKFSELVGDHLTFPIYGVGIQAYAPQRMYFYTKALRSAAKRIAPEKAVLVPVISPFNEQEMDSLMKIFGKTPGFEGASTSERTHQRKIHLLTPTEFYNLSTFLPGHVYLIFVGSVPQIVFNYFYEKANLPVWVAGKNAMSFVLGKGKPYFNTVNDYVLPDPTYLSEGSYKMVSRAYTAFNVGYQEFANQGRLKDLGQFIVEASRPGSEINTFFVRIGERMSTNDRVSEGLRHILGASTVSLCRHIFK